jgi:hypothetical protein
MSIFRLAVTAATVAVTIARHPAVRAGLKAAPHLVTPAMRHKAASGALATAYQAGRLARRIVPRQLID